MWSHYQRTIEGIEMNKTTEALKLAEEALDLAQALLEKSYHHATILNAYKETRKYREALAEQEKQEPVAIVDEIGKRLDGKYIFNAVGKVDVGQPLYAAPVDAKAIRSDALEQAEEIAKTIGGSFSVEFLATIRGLK